MQNTWGAAADLETSYTSLASSASNPVWGQSHLILFAPKQQTILGLHLQILWASMRVCPRKNVRIMHNFPFLWLSERRLYVYFQVFAPTGLKYISPESYSGVSSGTFSSGPKHPLVESSVGLGRPLKATLSHQASWSAGFCYFFFPPRLFRADRTVLVL